MKAAIHMGLLVTVLFVAHPGDAANVSGTFTEDLPQMRDRATRDMKVLHPGEEKAKAQRAFNLVSVLQKVENGDRFAVDTEDQYVGAIIQLHSGVRTRRPFETPKDEVIFVEYYQKSKALHAVQIQLLKGNWTEAANVAASMGEKYPAYGPAWTSLGLAKTAAGDYRQAHTFFEKAKVLSVDPQAYHASALTYLAQGKRVEAKEEIEIAIALDPGLKELSFPALESFKVAKPQVWAAYRDQLGGKVSPEVIERAFEARAPQSELKPRERYPGLPIKKQQGIEKTIPEGTGKAPMLPPKKQ